jgi:hypothetical protein
MRLSAFKVYFEGAEHLFKFWNSNSVMIISQPLVLVML